MKMTVPVFLILKCPFDQTKYYCLTANDIKILGGGDNSNKEPSYCTEKGCISDFIGTGTPQIGSILYSDGTINTTLINGKNPIAIVFDPDNRLAAALEEKELAWLDDGQYTGIDIPGLDNLDESSANNDMNGLENTLIISEYCKAMGKSCPATEYVLNYKTEGTIAGQWFLGSGGQIVTLMKTKETLNPILSSINKTQLEKGSSSLNDGKGYWTSTEPNSRPDNFSYFCTGTGTLEGVYFSYYKNTPRRVRPIIHFTLKE